MAIKTILVPMDGGESSMEVLDTAFVVAARFGAHIQATHVMPGADEAEPFTFARLSAKLKETVRAEAQAGALENAAGVRARFEESCAKHGVTLADKPAPGNGPTASWKEVFGRVSEVLVQEARLTDVTAIARPRVSASTVRRSPAGENLESIMLGSGRPVLIVPPKWTARRCEHAAIGWNASVEAARTVATTIPWLREMQAVTVVAAKKREASANDLLAYLAWHGVDAQIKFLDGKGSTVGASILNVCGEVEAEMLMVGGFSHARARQLLFGGVTRHLLDKVEILTVMVH